MSKARHPHHRPLSLPLFFMGVGPLETSSNAVCETLCTFSCLAIHTHGAARGTRGRAHRGMQDSCIPCSAAWRHCAATTGTFQSVVDGRVHRKKH